MGNNSGGFLRGVAKGAVKAVGGKVSEKLAPRVVRRHSDYVAPEPPDRPWHEEGTIGFEGAKNQEYRHVVGLMLEVGKYLRGEKRHHPSGTKYDKRTKQLCIPADDTLSTSQQSMMLRYANDFAGMKLCKVLGWDYEGNLVIEVLKR